MPTFRVHYYNTLYNENAHRDEEANTSEEARAEFVRKHGYKMPITKIKLVRDE